MIMLSEKERKNMEEVCSKDKKKKEEKKTMRPCEQKIWQEVPSSSLLMTSHIVITYRVQLLFKKDISG